VHTQTTARAQWIIHRSRATAIHCLAIRVPLENALRTRIAFNHALDIVVGVMRNGFDSRVITGLQLQQRLHGLAEITPVDSLVISRDVVVADLFAGFLGRQRTLGNACQTGDACCRLTADSGAQALTRFLELALQIGVVQVGKVVASGAADMVSHNSPESLIFHFIVVWVRS